MTLTRTPSWLLMPELADPGNAPTDYAWLFTRDDGGVTKISYRTSSGPLIDVDTPPIGPGSGGEFINLARDYSLNSSGLAAAFGDCKSGDTVYVDTPSLAVTSNVSVPAGVHLLGQRLTGEGSYARLYASASMTNLVTLHDGSSISGFTADSNGNADHAIYVDGQGATVAYNKPTGGRLFCIRNNSTGADRTTFSHNRCETGGTGGIIGVYGKDNLVDSNVGTGAHSGAPVVLAACDSSKFYVGHYTGNSGSADCLRVTGDYNSFTAVVGDTCAGPADGVFGVWGNFNTFYACGTMNVANGITKPIIAFRPSKGNQVYGIYYTKGGQATGSCAPAVHFLDSSGNVLANTAGNRALFPGTRVYWSASNVSAVGGEFSNFQPVNGDAIDLVGSNGSSAQDYRT